jgi:hypothetical protein
MDRRRLRWKNSAWNISGRAWRGIVVNPRQPPLRPRVRGSRHKADERNEDGDTEHEALADRVKASPQVARLTHGMRRKQGLAARSAI